MEVTANERFQDPMIEGYSGKHENILLSLLKDTGISHIRIPGGHSIVAVSSAVAISMALRGKLSHEMMQRMALNFQHVGSTYIQ